MYAYGAARAFGVCPFGIDSLRAPANPGDAEPAIMKLYAAISSLEDMLTVSADARTHTGSWCSMRTAHARRSRLRWADMYLRRPYRGPGPRARCWRTTAACCCSSPGRMSSLWSAAGLTVKMSRDPDTDARVSGIASIEEVSRAGAEWAVIARLNGDQSNQGRQLTMDPRKIRIYRVRLYTASQIVR